MTLPTFTTYSPPDVYVSDTTRPIIVAPGVAAQIMALVGPALGYRTATQSFLISANQAAVLDFTGVFTLAVDGPPAIGAPVVTRFDGTALQAGVDYSLTVSPDPTGNASLAITSVARVVTSGIVSDGDQVSITYNYADAGYYQPQLFTDFQSVVNAYGPPLLSSTVGLDPGASQVANPLSFGAQMAFANGANTLITLACDPSAGDLSSQLAAAYDKLSTTYQATIIVPVFPDDFVPLTGPVDDYAAILAADLKAACLTASAAGYPRIGFFGLPRNYDESAEPVNEFASVLGSSRIVVAYPPIVQVFNGLTGQVFNSAGCYLAVALGALLSALPVNTGLTRQLLNGFAGLTQSEVANMTQALMNNLAAAGTCVTTQSRTGALVCRHGLTTDMSAVNKREISLVRQADALLVSLGTGLENSGLIGSPITADMVAQVDAAVTSILEQDIANLIIVSWTNLTVTQQVYPGGDPTVINVNFSYVPAVPLNYIDVTFSIDLSSGQVTLQSAQNAAAA